MILQIRLLKLELRIWLRREILEQRILILIFRMKQLMRMIPSKPTYLLVMKRIPSHPSPP